MKTLLYARVSKDDMHCENQKRILYDWCTKQGISDTIYLQDEISSRKTRPAKEEGIKLCRSGVVETVVVVRIDRFARSLQELVMDVRAIIDRGGRFVAIMNSFDFQKASFNASQSLMLNIFASFAEFEREMIRERTIEGLERAKAQGKKLGRPFKKPPLETLPVAIEEKA